MTVIPSASFTEEFSTSIFYHKQMCQGIVAMYQTTK
jgi:hypothetical protein